MTCSLQERIPSAYGGTGHFINTCAVNCFVLLMHALCCELLLLLLLPG
jgi:hypothetical protein